MGNYITKEGDDEYYYKYDEQGRFINKSIHKLDNGTYQTNCYNKYKQLTSVRFHKVHSDLQNGLLRCYENGKIFAEFIYENSERNGPYKFYSNEKIYESGIMKNNAKHGIITEYIYNYHDKTIKQTITTVYANGIKHGSCKFYDKDNILTKTIIYEYGTEIETILPLVNIENPSKNTDK